MVGNLTNTVGLDSIAFVDYKHKITYAYDYKYYLNNGKIIHNELEAKELCRLTPSGPLHRLPKFRLNGVFYKVGVAGSNIKDLHRWIDVSSAMTNSLVMDNVDFDSANGNMYVKAIAEKAYELNLHSVYLNGKYIPSGYYCDEYGLSTELPINDGERNDYIKEIYPVYTKDKYTYDFFVSSNGHIGTPMNASNAALATALRFTMNDPDTFNIDDILFTVNGLFYGRSTSSLLRRDTIGRTAAYIEDIRPTLPIEKPFFNPLLGAGHPDQNNTSHYMVSPNLHKWDGVKISEALIAQSIVPIQTVKAPMYKSDLQPLLDGDLNQVVLDADVSVDLNFNRQFGSYMLFYNNMWINSTRSISNVKSSLRIDIDKPIFGEEMKFLNEYDENDSNAEKFWLLEFTAEDGSELFIDQMDGVPNYLGKKNIVRFKKPITNSIITYNGVLLQYLIIDPYTIQYTSGRYSLNTLIDSVNSEYAGTLGVEDDAQIVAHTFHKKVS